MMEATQHAIYVTEQLIEQSFEGEDRSSYHTALWYVQERDGEADVVQQLHFNDHSDSFWEEDMGTVKMVPNVRYGLCRSQDPEKMGMVAVKRGHEAEILAYWNHMLAFSADVRQQQLTFDLQDSHLAHSNNCRSGVIAALKTIGVEYDPRLYKSESGTIAGRIRPGEVMQPQDTVGQNVDDQRKLNEHLASLLTPPWQEEKLKQSTALSTKTLTNIL